MKRVEGPTETETVTSRSVRCRSLTTVMSHLVLLQQHLHTLKIVAVFLRHCQRRPLLDPELMERRAITVKDSRDDQIQNRL